MNIHNPAPGALPTRLAPRLRGAGGLQEAHAMTEHDDHGCRGGQGRADCEIVGNWWIWMALLALGLLGIVASVIGGA